MTADMLDQLEQAWRAHNSLLEAACKVVAALGVTFEECRLLTEPELNGGKKDTLVVRGVPTFVVETTVRQEIRDDFVGLIFTTHPPHILAFVDEIHSALVPVFAELSSVATVAENGVLLEPAERP